MKQGYTVCVSDEARKEHENRPKPVRKKTDCPSCEIRPGTTNVSCEIQQGGANETGKGDK